MNSKVAWNDGFSDLGRNPLPVDLYHDETAFQLQKDRIFKRAWLFAGMKSSIPRSGDYFIRSVPTFGFSLIFVRGKDETIRAFYNVCTHRGTDLCNNDHGNVSRFVCPFHAWSFDTHGNLVAITEERSFFNLERNRNGLRPVQIDTCGDLIFFNLDESPTHTLQDFLGEIAPILDVLEKEKLTAHSEFDVELECNWMTVLDAARESYHFGVLHKGSGGGAVSDPDHMGELLEARNMGFHCRGAYWGNPRYKPSPLEKIVAQASMDSAGLTAGTAQKGPSPLLNISKSNEWAHDVLCIFPNVVLASNGSSMVVQQTWPITAHLSLYETGCYFPEPQTAAERFAIEHYGVRTRDVLIEDIMNSVRIHGNYAAGAISNIHYSDHEIMLRHQYHIVRTWMNEDSNIYAA